MTTTERDRLAMGSTTEQTYFISRPPYDRIRGNFIAQGYRRVLVCIYLHTWRRYQQSEVEERTPLYGEQKERPR